VSADIASRVAVLEERSKEDEKKRIDMVDDIKCIKAKVYEMAASFKVLKWILMAMLPILGIVIPIVLT
jgi:hypothetical protein